MSEQSYTVIVVMQHCCEAVKLRMNSKSRVTAKVFQDYNCSKLQLTKPWAF